jgi:RNA polymerase sigma-70 factor (ECF subfamily)
MNPYHWTAAVASESAALTSGEGRTRDAFVRQPFRQVFDEHAVAVGRTLRYLGVPEADVADAAQQVFLVVHRRYAEFEGRSSLSTWIREISVRVALSHRRHERRRREDVVEDPPHRSIDADQDRHVERDQLRELLTSLLTTLDDNHRALIVLYDIEMMSMAEVAQVLGCPLQTAYSRRATALEKLRGVLLERNDQRATSLAGPFAHASSRSVEHRPNMPVPDLTLLVMRRCSRNQIFGFTWMSTAVGAIL